MATRFCDKFLSSLRGESKRSIDAAISGCLTRLLRRFAPRNDELGITIIYYDLFKRIIKFGFASGFS